MVQRQLSRQYIILDLFVHVRAAKVENAPGENLTECCPHVTSIRLRCGVT
jgi:hypothetical protein